MVTKIRQYIKNQFMLTSTTNAFNTISCILNILEGLLMPNFTGKNTWKQKKNKNLTSSIPNSIGLSAELLIYKEVLEPVWTYELPLWRCASASNLQIIQIFHNKVLRRIVECKFQLNLFIKKVLRYFRKQARSSSCIRRIGIFGNLFSRASTCLIYCCLFLVVREL